MKDLKQIAARLRKVRAENAVTASTLIGLDRNDVSVMSRLDQRLPRGLLQDLPGPTRS